MKKLTTKKCINIWTVISVLLIVGFILLFVIDSKKQELVQSKIKDVDIVAEISRQISTLSVYELDISELILVGIPKKKPTHYVMYHIPFKAEIGIRAINFTSTSDFNIDENKKHVTFRCPKPEILDIYADPNMITSTVLKDGYRNVLLNYNTNEIMQKADLNVRERICNDSNFSTIAENRLEKLVDSFVKSIKDPEWTCNISFF